MMPTPETALRAWMIADPALAGLVGTRIYPHALPQTPTLPACTYRRVSYRRPDEIPFATVRIQVTAWGDTYTSARAVADALKTAADRKKGTSSGLTVVYASVQGDLELVDPVTGRYTVPVDFQVTYKES